MAAADAATLLNDDDDIKAGPGPTPCRRRCPMIRTAVISVALLASALMVFMMNGSWRHQTLASRGPGRSLIVEVEPTTGSRKNITRDNAKKPPKDGCCAWGDHTHCAKPYESCQTGLQGECCSGNTKWSLEACEKCKGEWIVLPQKMCDTGHSWEKPLPHISDYKPSGTKHNTKVRVLSYNLFWWKLFEKMGGNGGSAGKLMKAAAAKIPFDFIGFQECMQPYRVLYDAGMDKDFWAWHTNQNICIAIRTKAWKVLKKGEKIVANDQQKKGQNFGQRTGAWVQLQHRKTNETVFFMNHHGPLPLSTGGQWGGPATAYNLLTLIGEQAKNGEPIIFVGDFNSVATSMTVQQVGCGLNNVFSGTKFGGVDHIFSNLQKAHIVSTANLGQGGSDHDAISAIFEL